MITSQTFPPDATGPQDQVEGLLREIHRPRLRRPIRRLPRADVHQEPPSQVGAAEAVQGSLPENGGDEVLEDRRTTTSTSSFFLQRRHPLERLDEPVALGIHIRAETSSFFKVNLIFQIGPRRGPPSSSRFRREPFLRDAPGPTVEGGRERCPQIGQPALESPHPNEAVALNGDVRNRGGEPPPHSAEAADILELLLAPGGPER